MYTIAGGNNVTPMLPKCYPEIDIEIEIEIEIDFVVRSRLPLPLHRSILKQQAFVLACHGSGIQRVTRYNGRQSETI